MLERLVTTLNSGFGFCRYLIVVIFFMTAPAQADSAMVTKAELQAAMHRYIEAKSDEGTFLYVDSLTGSLNRLRPLAAHPKILMTDAYYILCSDFRAAGGERVNVDFFVAKTKRGFLVFEHTVEEREQVKRWMKAGVARKYN